MSFFDSTKSIIENLYLLSGPLLLIAALFGLRQLKITKDSIRITSKRQAITLSFELCEKYEKIIEKQYEKLYIKMQELGIQPVEIELLNPSKLEIFNKSTTNNTQFKKCIEKYDELSLLFINLANELEGFSSAFVKGIADEALAYDLQFTQFYYWSTICLPEIYKSQSEKENVVQQVSYCNLCELYSMWKARNEKEILSRQVANLIRKNASIKERSIKPFGTV